MMISEAVVKVRLDPSELYDAIDNLPDELLDRLADKLTAPVTERIEQHRAVRRRAQGRDTYGL